MLRAAATLFMLFPPFVFISTSCKKDALLYILWQNNKDSKLFCQAGTTNPHMQPLSRCFIDIRGQKKFNFFSLVLKSWKKCIWFYFRWWFKLNYSSYLAQFRGFLRVLLGLKLQSVGDLANTFILQKGAAYYQNLVRNEETLTSLGSIYGRKFSVTT